MNSICRKIYLELKPPGNGDMVADKDRIVRALKNAYKNVNISADTLKSSYKLLRDFDWKLTVTMIKKDYEWEIVRLERGNTTERNFGYAADLGSTTVIMRLLDLNSGDVLGEESIFNKQIKYGEEIISRIIHAKDNESHLKELQQCTLSSISDLIDSLHRTTGISPAECSILTIGGNTTMIHLLLGIDPWFIFHTPYTPSFNRCGFVQAKDLALPFNGLVYCYPSVANYVGGDIVSGLLASEMYKSEELGLYIDIGTNGEMLLGNNQFILSAAGAAGPALEGGISKQGMQAKPGAVDSVRIINNQIMITTIQAERPIGICGSGIVDLLAEMLLEGWIDFSGSFNPEKSERIVIRDNEYAVVYAWELESGSNEELLFTQTDIQRFMNTKAAAGTMVSYLLEALNVEPGDIQKVYIAGAFGTHINLESAITIGLYPDLPRERFVIVGNGSLEGAAMLLVNAALLSAAENIIEDIDYLSLGEATDFLTKMYAAKFLPHTNFELYPTVMEKLKVRRTNKTN
ncbi:MAG: hypothetical protein AWM53_00752 [Candidatus Dichloromethanomonas elyunquensis]|nr:MAG: hypothetical protein AWM53_00752 [Candidatus Dichloromethanomonas elyunquensis]